MSATHWNRHISKSSHSLICVKSLRKDPTSTHPAGPGHAPVFFGINGSFVSVYVWRCGIIRFPWLIFSFFFTVFLKHSSNQPERTDAITRGDSWRRHRKDPGLQTSGRARLPWLPQPRDEKRKKTLRCAGIKVCPGCLSHRGLPQHIQMEFPERSRSHKQTFAT